MSVSYIPHQSDIDGPHYELWSAIFSKAGSATTELGITKELCELRDLTRLEASIKYLRDYVIAMGKSFRELQSLSAAPAEKSETP